MSILSEKYNSFFLKNSQKIVVLLALSFIVYFYSPLLFHPQNYILNDKGDAIKNYYCYDWHIHNDTSYINFSGTNYPFGELHAYTDGNPLLGNLIRTFSFLNPWSIALFNITLLLSFLFCAVLVFKILDQFKVPRLYSIISSTGIMILCPQAFRLSGHFALSYSFSIPLIIYLLILFESRDKKYYYTLLISAALICLFFIHQYLGMICSSFIILYWFLGFCFKFNHFKKLMIHFVSQAVFPIIFYLVHLKLTDTHSNRTSNPYGFLYFTANIDTVFISTLPPFRHFLSLLYKITIQNWEGIAYVGLCSTLTILFLPFLIIKKRLLLKSYLDKNSNERTLFFMLAASVLLLFFSMGYPFKWNMQWLLDYFPVIKQFRAPGRFAWVFYFIITIFSTVLISRYFFKKLSQNFRMTLCSLLLFLYALEGIPYHSMLSKDLIVKNCFELNNVDKELKDIIAYINKSRTQAIIPLPFFHIGTDYYNFEGTEKIKKAAFVTSFHTKKPLMANLTPRTSLTESEYLIQLLGDDLLEKKLKPFIPSKAPILILYSKENLSEEEISLLNKGKVVLETANYLLKEVSIDELFLNERLKQIQYFNTNKQDLIPSGNCFITDSSYFTFNDFDSLPDKTFINNSEDSTIIFEIPENSLEKNIEYQVSFWFESKNLNNMLVVKEKTSNTLSERNINTMPNIQNNKTLAILNFKTENPANKCIIYLKKDKDSKANFRLDNFMIKRKYVNAYKMIVTKQHKDSLLVVNNFVLPLP